MTRRSRGGRRQTASPAPRHASPLHEPSAWLRERINYRIAQSVALGFRPHAAPPVLVLPLGSSGPPGSREDRACDRCDVFISDGQDIYMHQIRPLPGLMLCGGLCATCNRLEVGS